MTQIKMGSPGYRKLAREYAEAVQQREAGDLSDELYRRIVKLSDKMQEVELAHEKKEGCP